MSQPLLSWCLIARNEGANGNLECCLKSVRERTPNAEIIVVDTCSKDNTLEIAQKYGAVTEVYKGPRGDWTVEMPWFDDSSAARNRSFELATGKYVGWIDADDRLPGPEEAEKLLKLNALWRYGPPRLLKVPKGAVEQENCDSKVIGLEELIVEAFEKDGLDCLWAPYLYAYDENFKGKVVHPRERIVKNKADWHWTGPAHEILVPKTPNFHPKQAFVAGLLFIHMKKFTLDDQNFSTDRHWDVLMQKRAAGTITAHDYSYLFTMCGAKNPALFADFAREAKLLCSSDAELFRIRQVEGEFYHKRGYYMESADAMGSARELMPELPDAFLKSGDIACLREEWASAVDFYNSGLSKQLHPILSEVSQRDFRIQFKERLAYAAGRNADQLVKYRNYPAALYLYEKALAVATEVANDEAVSVEKDEADAFVAHFGKKASALRNFVAFHGYVKQLLADGEIARAQLTTLSASVSFEAFPDYWMLRQEVLEKKPQEKLLTMLRERLAHLPEHCAVGFEIPFGTQKEAGEIEPILPYDLRTVATAVGARVRNAHLWPEYLDGHASVEFEKAVPLAKKPLVFTTAGTSHESWNMTSMLRTGIGASEETIAYLMRRLASDREVDLYGQVPDEISLETEINHFVGYWPSSMLGQASKNATIVVSRNFAMADDLRGRDLVLWLQDTDYPDITPERIKAFRKIVAVSNWHKSYLLSSGQLNNPDQIAVIPNFLLREHFEMVVPPPRRPHHFIYASSPDRGLGSLLQLWPKVLELYPDATLDIFYGWDNLKSLHRQSAMWTNVYRKARRAVDEALAKYPSIRDRGRINHVNLAVEMHHAAVWPYLTRFCETDCNTARKMRAAGVVPVVTPVAGLNESAKSQWTQWVDPDATDEKLIEQFLAGVKVAVETPESERAKMMKEAVEEGCLEARLPLWHEVLG